jgi:hypothetical protein
MRNGLSMSVILELPGWHQSTWTDGQAPSPLLGKSGRSLWMRRWGSSESAHLHELEVWGRVSCRPRGNYRQYELVWSKWSRWIFSFEGQHWCPKSEYCAGRC